MLHQVLRKPKSATPWLLVAAVVTFMVLSASLCFFLEKYLQSESSETSSQVSEQKARQIEQHLTQNLAATYALAALVRQGHGAVRDFDAITEQFIALHPGVSALQLAPKGIVEQIYPLSGNEKAIGDNLLSDGRRSREARLALETGKLTLAGPFELLQGGEAILGRLPVYLGEAPDSFWGFATAIMRLPDFLKAIRVDELRRLGYDFELWRYHPENGIRHVFANSNTAPISDGITTSINIPNGQWYLTITPSTDSGRVSRIAIEVGVVLLVTLALALALYHYHGTQLDLETSRERYQALYEATPAMLHSIDAEGRIVSVSNQWLQTMGYAREEVVGRKSSDFLTEDSRHFAVATVLPAFFQTGSCSVVPYQFVTKSGQILDVELSAIAEHDSDGRVIRSLAVVNDVTARNHLAAVATKNKQRLELALAGGELGWWHWDVESNRVNVSPRCLEMLGYGPHELGQTSDDILGLIYPEDLLDLHAAVKAHQESAAGFEREIRVLHKNRNWVPILLRGKVVERDTQGLPAKVAGTSMDITQRKANEAALIAREARLSALISTLQDIVAVYDTGGVLVDYFHPVHAKVPPIKPRAEMLGKTNAEILPPAVAQLFDDAMVGIIGDGLPREFEYRLFLSGAEILSHVSLRPLMDESRYVTGFLALIRDVTEEDAARREIEHLAHTNALLLESVGEGIFGVDMESRTIFVNQRAVSMLGYSEAEILGEKQHFLFHARHEDGSPYPAEECPIFKTLQDRIVRHESEEWFWRKNGTGFPVYLTVTPVIEDGQQKGVVVIFRDVTVQKAAEATIRTLAYHDTLTQLPNRRNLLDRLENTLHSSQRRGTWGALLFLDLDNFKSLNDSRGHDAGDALLIEAARRLRACVRPDDTVARIGGDEFVVMLIDLSLDASQARQQADKLASKICQVLSSPYAFDGFDHHCSASIGVCLFKGLQMDSTEILKRADTAMYRAKNSGKNRINFFDEIGSDAI